MKPLTDEIWENGWNQVPVPTGLPRPLFEGRPVPFTTKLGSHKGFTTPNFSDVHKARFSRCLKHNLCLLCGDPLGATSCVIGRYRGGNTLASAMEFIDEGLLHERCARMTKAHCPHLASDSFQILIGPTADVAPYDKVGFRRVPESFRLVRTNHPVPQTVLELDAKANEQLGAPA